MPSFSKDKATGKWFCSDCGEEIPKEIVFAGYNYFNSENNKEHKCKGKRLKAGLAPCSIQGQPNNPKQG